MPRTKELAFLREKLNHADETGDMAYAVDINDRIKRLQKEVGEFRRGERRKPW